MRKNTLKDLVIAELEKKGKSFNWLLEQIDMSFDGLTKGLTNESIKLRDLKKLVAVLNMPIQTFFEGSYNTVQTIRGDNNKTQAHLSQVSEPEAQYEIRNLQREVELLEKALADKDKIIDLLSKK